MAFLTSRLGNLKEDNMGHSARSLPAISNDSPQLSVRSYDSSMSSVSHVNSVKLFEKFALLDGLSEDNVNYGKMSGSQAEIVPPLDIISEENYPTTRNYTFSYRKDREADKTALKPDKAFETWLSAKRKMLSDDAARRRKEAEEKQKKIEERKRLAKEKYDSWLQKKSQSSITLQSISNYAEKSATNCATKTQTNQSPEKARARLQEWEREKRIKEEQRRNLKRQEEQRQRELEEQRRLMAAEAWDNWVANANKKPKPVPLNRGIFTLRGTVSDIYVNPNEWKPIIPENNEHH